MYCLEDFFNAIPNHDYWQNHIKPNQPYHCFAGAWYYKVVTSREKWLGIEAKITLPIWIPDETRFEMIDSRFGIQRRNLDTPSVYVGGSSDYETDIGFGYFFGMIDGHISDEKICFRPFWRTIFLENNQEKNVYDGVKIEQSEFYFYPGDQVLLQLVCETNDHLTLRIELLKPTTIAPYTTYREKGNPNQVFIIKNIKAPGNGFHDAEYKMVNAIDQYHNEGKPTQQTEAKALHALWEDVYLFQEKNDQLIKVPFTHHYATEMMCPNEEGFQITHQQGKTFVDIDPSRKKE